MLITQTQLKIYVIYYQQVQAVNYSQRYFFINLMMLQQALEDLLQELQQHIKQFEKKLINNNLYIMSNQSQNQNFYVVPIPQNITVLQSFKKWRRTGENLNGAIMIGVLENFLLNGQLEKIQSILNNLKSVSDDQIKKIKDCIEKSLQFPKGDQKLDYIMDYLKSSDPHNIFAEKLILEYVKRVKGNLKSDDELIKISKNLFSVQISVIRDDDQNNFNIILDPKDKDLIILYNFNSKYYVIQKEVGPQLYKCLYCTKQISEDYYKMNCSQIICYQCLKKFFDQGHKQVQCKEKGCTSTITCNDYQKIQNKKKEIEKTAQLNQIIQQKAEEKGKSIQNDQDLSKKCLISKKHPESQLKQNNFITPQSNQEATNQCEVCFNFFQISTIYTAECSHKFCQICCDKEIKKNISCFQCYKVNCGYKIRIDDIQKFFYKKIQSLTFGNCANCNQECKIFQSFQNKCQHLICYNCVKQIYTEGRNSICKQCQIYINPKDLDDYYLPQASQEIQQIDPIQQGLEQLSCTFCNSPFTDYNLLQDIPCQIHLLGTCCIIFPADCPQCQIGSLIFEKKKLKFELYQNVMYNFNFASQSSIK
ncbi:unnamed protein product [Paramecium sonneborni]|uniref:RING-type domain-containing protein n=1 Tax=Paramecium sonneborni TaxID=65129 RepID=A0A8S1QAV1_9CILI|nr:unnamed protein product [Paramecium sonneborni]